MSTARYLKMSFPRCDGWFSNHQIVQKMQILQKSPEDVKLFHLNYPKLKSNMDKKNWKQLEPL